MWKCPFPGCRVQIEDDRFACRKHWFSIDRENQAVIYGAYARYTAGTLTLAQLRVIQAKVIADTTGGSKVPENARCGSCKALILWARSAKTNSPMPLNLPPSAEGNVVIVDGLAHVLGQGDLFEPMLPTEGPRYTSHFATCPNAERHRKKV